MMDPARWERVKEVFQEALERPLEERAPHLREVCREDSALQGDVERMLSAHERASDFLASPAFDLREPGPAEVEAAPLEPVRIRGYRIVREVGQGGMGTVYLAEREQPGFHKTVAIKVVRQGMETGFVVRRFQTERQILASLEHPGIARLYDGGTTDDGQPYFVMEYIEGDDLLTWCDARKLPIAERLRLFRRACDAVQFAHQNLVVHRDLKPSNILVTPEGEPKLLDFGIAKLLSPEGAGDETATLMRLMTPDFASPEQVLGRRVTTASDVYALGVVLYELLSGHRPYRVRGRPASEIERVVCEEPPDRPSTAAARGESVRSSEDEKAVLITPDSVSVSRATTPSRLRRMLRGDLDNIVLKALEKDPARRYATAADLSEDVRRNLEGFPVRALPDRPRYRAAKFVRRHRVAVVAALAASVALVAGLAVAVWQARVARAEREIAQRHLSDLRSLLTSVLFEFHDSVRDLPGATPVRELVVRRALEYLEKISRDEGANPDVQRELAEAYQRISRVQGGVFSSHLGDTAGALKSITRALEIRRALVRSYPTNKADQVGLAHAELDSAQVLLAAGDVEKAVQASNRAVASLQALALSNEHDRAIASELARSRRYLGMALSTAGRGDEALTSLRSAVREFSHIADEEPGNDTYRRELASSHQILIHNLPVSQKEEAAQSYATAVAIQNMLALHQPSNAGIKRELAYTHFSMGYFCERQGDTAQAVEAYSQALRIRHELADADPRNADAQLRLADAYHGLGFVEARAGLQGASENLLHALQLVESIARLDPASGRTTMILAYLYGSLGMASETGAPPAEIDQRLRTARDWYEKSRRVFIALRDQGRLSRPELSEIASLDEKISAIDRKLGAP